MKDFEYDVAFSFAGEQRQYVKDVYGYLTAKGIKVFYDQDEVIDTETWGQNLVDYFNDIFTHKARFCVVFISQEYANKVWTNYERQVIQARGLVDNGYILPARFDGTKLAGGIDTTKYVNLSHLSPEEFAGVILRKIRSKSTPDAPPEITFRTPRVPKIFNPYKERELWIETISGEIVKRCEAIPYPPTECTHLKRGDKDSLRIIVDGKVIYALDIERGGSGSDEGFSFSQAEGSSRIGGGYQAQGELAWDKNSNAVILELMDFSLLNMLSTDSKYSLEGFIDGLWNKIVDLIEAHAEGVR